MNNFYMLKTLSGAEEYIKLTGPLSELKTPCRKSEIQYLDKSRITLGISHDAGLEIPDIIYQDGIFFISGQMKNCLDSRGIDYVFYKQADIISDKFGIHETFWVMVPPRIDCLDIDKSDICLEWDFEDGLVPVLDANRIRLVPKMIGRFEIFKILGVADNNVYITKRLCEILRTEQFEGIEFMLLQ